VARTSGGLNRRRCVAVRETPEQGGCGTVGSPLATGTGRIAAEGANGSAGGSSNAADRRCTGVLDNRDDDTGDNSGCSAAGMSGATIGAVAGGGAFRVLRGFGGADDGDAVGTGVDGGTGAPGSAAIGCFGGRDARGFFFIGGSGDGFGCSTAAAAAPDRVTAPTSNSSSDAIDDNDVSEERRVMDLGPGFGSTPTKRAAGGMYVHLVSASAKQFCSELK
jgi:hypothetical protein